MSKLEAKKIAKKYAQKLKKKKFPYFAIYMFGSFAKGKAHKWSDIDIAVLSSKLRRNWNENEEKLWRYAIEVDSRIEPIGFTPEDFEINEDPMVYEIKKTGIRIA